MKKHEILGELPKCATAMSKYYWRNGTNMLARHRVGHKPTTCKTVVYAKCSKVVFLYFRFFLFTIPIKYTLPHFQS